MNLIQTIILATCFSLISMPPFALSEPVPENDQADEYIRAAQNYESAASVRSEIGEALLVKARELRKTDYKDNLTREINITKAGNYEKQAGSLFSSSSQGYDKASKVWQKAAKSYKNNDPANAKVKARLLLNSKLTFEAGTKACQRAAESYEFSAEAFKDIDAGRMAQSSDLAARMRETLAMRLSLK